MSPEPATMAAPPPVRAPRNGPGGSTTSTAADQQRPPRPPPRRVSFIRIENANGDATAPAPGSGVGGVPLAAAASPVGGPKGAAHWGARPPLVPSGVGGGTPRMASSLTPRAHACGGGGSLPGSPRSCAGTPRCRHAAMAPPAPPPPKPVAAQNHKYFKVILWASFMLTINAGFINTITLNNLHQMPSAHVTGIVARASNYAAEGQGWLCAQYMVAYCCFLAGACISGMLINYETFYLGRSYGRALFIIAAVQSVALLTENVYDDSIWFIWLCCICCGLQNGLTSKYSGNAVRTTHLTGATTDLGIAIGHILKGRSGEWWKVQLHGIALVGFFIGGVLGVYAFRHYEHGALLFNVGLTAALALAHTCYVSYHERMSVLAVLESKSDIRMHKKRVQRIEDPAHPSKSPLHGGSRPGTPSLLNRHASAAQRGGATAGGLSSPAAAARALLSPSALAKGIFQRRHFPRNGSADDLPAAAAAAATEGKQALLLAPPPHPPSAAASPGGGEKEDKAEAKDSAARGDRDLEAGGGGRRGGPPPPAPAMAPSPSSRFHLLSSLLARVGASPRAGGPAVGPAAAGVRGGGLQRQQSLPVLRADQQAAAQAAAAAHQQHQHHLQQHGGRGPWHGHGTHVRALQHHHSLPVNRGAPVYHYHDELYPGSCCSTPRTLKDWCEDEGLVPMPEDVGETGLYAQGEEPMLPSPVDGFDEEEGLELDWYGGCSGCDCDGATPANGTPVEGEFGASPRCSFFFAGAGAGQDGEGEEEDDEDDPPTDDDIDGLDIEQGGAPLLSAAAAAPAPAPAAAVAALQKPPPAPRGLMQPVAGDRGKRRALGMPPLTRGTSL